MKYITYGEIMGTRAEKSSQNLQISVLAWFFGAKQTMTLLYLPYVTAHWYILFYLSTEKLCGIRLVRFIKKEKFCKTLINEAIEISNIKLNMNDICACDLIE